MSSASYIKSRPGVPQGFFECEAAGLRWLAAAHDDGGARVVRVEKVAAEHLQLVRIHPTKPTRKAAAEFGAGLAHTHNAGADGFGAPPQGWSGDGFFGPLSDPRPMRMQPRTRFGEFWAEDRIRPCLDELSGVYGPAEMAVFDRLCQRLHDGEFDDDDPAARLHGDLWSGNLMWDDWGAVLIDPAAHGGHREEDLAMLSLFGCPHYDAIIGGYEEVHPLPAGRTERIGLHQLYGVLMHAVLFGGGYASQALATAQRYV
ncbi:fructosamine kinase family protein [Corynebacterium sp. TAE3-ERU12]|uniref:fructosamine kinase family protein n=1 Tax=Corynebacterium sp. TAE3-ERU12 TaxID=2849491 RepID=UPI001C45FC5A|nr:fructosamine kinase family protein [Corynebacterium sp. TAE3-ERU12]MBV7296085.1 fructosamine kinase family protein [Corynebacterium sp. TAE3-ERU12]